MEIEIIEYNDRYHDGWVECRVLSFLDSSYFDDVYRTKTKEVNPELSLIALENGIVVGFIDIEYEKTPKTVCHLDGGLGGVIWHLGVRIEYRRHKIASKLLNEAIKILKKMGIKRLEAWTQDDFASNNWYENQGFTFVESYLNCFVNGKEHLEKYVNIEKMGKFYGIRNFNFEAPINRKEELSKVCYRMHEVKLYEKVFDE